jgi:hypothetical protein
MHDARATRISRLALFACAEPGRLGCRLMPMVSLGLAGTRKACCCPLRHMWRRGRFC